MSDPARDWITSAIAGRPLPGQVVSGDVGLVLGAGDTRLLAAVDGLGHGTEAERAAAAAARCISEMPDDDLGAMLRACDDALTSTRGAAVSLARMHANQVIQWVGVGNVDATLLRIDVGGVRHVQALLPVGGVVGQGLPRLHIAEIGLAPGDVVLLTSDGVERAFVDQVRLADGVGGIACSVIEHFARENDDALAVVARFLGSRG